jgi:hypothetical protein
MDAGVSVLDEFCAITRYTRKYGLVLLSRPPAEQSVTTRRGRRPSYGPAEVALLRVCWAAAGRHLFKASEAFLPELLDRSQRRRHRLGALVAQPAQLTLPVATSTSVSSMANRLCSPAALPRRTRFSCCCIGRPISALVALSCANMRSRNRRQSMRQSRD